MKDRNRYGSYSQKKLPREKRTIPLSGSLEDDGKYFRCWNCGFTCDKDRDRIETGEHGTGGVVVTAKFEYLVDENGTEIVDETDDQIIVEWSDVGIEIIKGCPFCGSTNYR